MSAPGDGFMSGWVWAYPTIKFLLGGASAVPGGRQNKILHLLLLFPSFQYNQTMHKVEVLEHKTFAQLMSVAEIQPPAARSGSPVDDSEDGVRYFRSLVAAYRPSGSRGVFGEC